MLEYEIDIDEIMNIYERVSSGGLNPKEEEIVSRLYEELSNLDKDSTLADYDSVTQEIADQYGISVSVIEDIKLREVLE